MKKIFVAAFKQFSFLGPTWLRYYYLRWR